jgi:hypothetical protein
MNPDKNFRLLMSIILLALAGVLFWSCKYHFLAQTPKLAANPSNTNNGIGSSDAHDVSNAPDASVLLGSNAADSSRAFYHDNNDKKTPTTVYAAQTAAQTPPKTFTLVVLPDTQIYAEKYPDIFCEQTDWIVANKEKLNIQFVSQLGDIINDHKDRIDEWETATKCMKRLDDAKIPYGIIPGNHDSDTQYREDGMVTYDKYFPASRYSANYWYKAARKGNDNNYEIINVATGGATMQIMFVNLEIEPSDHTIAWANDVLKANPGIFTILTTHKYLPDTDDGKRDVERAFSKTGNTGEGLWQKLVKGNCSIRMVLNGHYHKTDGESMLVSKNSCGNDVEQIIQDYQAREVGGNGRLRIYTFDPAAKTIKAQTYSPHTKTFESDGDSEFEIPFNI